MEREKFKELIGKDIVVDYPFFNETQQWDMRNFILCENGEIKHNRIDDLIVDNFIAGAENPHKGEPTHG